jgi:uncharacterized protein YdiU (UPF0061 family)
MTYNFQTTYTKLSPKPFQKVEIPKILDAKIILINSALMRKLKIDYSQDQNPQELLKSSEPFAQSYAGHQFGHFTMLGDGRAMILGEHVVKDKRCDIQLKGSGITRYSRGGDGKATDVSMIREYLYSYALKNLGITTSESLAVLSTNEKVLREKMYDGAILIRVMQSHIRFGTFEFVSKFSKEELKEFTNYVINRHYPEITDEKQKYVKFFQAVIENTTDMVVDWYRVGFIHGVMNTDNMSITGETFDYGPCSFMNRYDPMTTFSRIDTYRRYSFGNQKEILKWNLGVLGKTLIPLFGKDIELARKIYEKELEKFDLYFEKKFMNMMKRKLGITNSMSAKGLINAFLYFLEKNGADYTNTFIELMYPNSINDEIYHKPEFLNLRTELRKVGLNLKLMQKSNPQRILRNYLVEKALDEYKTSKRLDKIHELLEAVSSPYTKNNKLEKFEKPPYGEFDKTYKTHCNT